FQPAIAPQLQNIARVAHASGLRSKEGKPEACATLIGVPYKLKPLARSIWISTSSPISSLSPSPVRRSLGEGGNTAILLVRVRPIRRAGFVLLGPSERTSTRCPTSPSPA